MGSSSPNDIIKNENRKNENLIGRKPIPLETAFNLSKSLCKIFSEEKGYGTGFFMKYNLSNCLITANHVIDSNLINKNIEIELYNKNKYNIELNKNRFFKFLEELDITIIEIKDSDNIKDIEYLYHDLNYIQGGYKQYKEIDILSLGYPNGDKLSTGSGRIKNIINEFEFEHDIPTQNGSSGSPIILFDLLKVIGIHKQGDIKKNINIGTFIGEIFNEKYENNEIIGNENNINKIDESKILDLNNKNLGNEGIKNIKFRDYNKIIKLDLRDNEISDINILEKVDFKELKELDLSSNKISNIEVLKNVKFYKLEKLDLGHNEILNAASILAQLNPSYKLFL